MGLCLGAVAIVTVANLHGVKESGRLFAAPPYAFIAAGLDETLHGATRNDVTAFSRNFHRADAKEGVKAFMEKPKPQFTGE